MINYPRSSRYRPEKKGTRKGPQQRKKTNGKTVWIKKPKEK
jgi:hypothetical protein